jgi:hypothetical protein
MGFVRRQVAVAVATQAMTVALVGLVVGLPVGAAVGRWVWIVTAEAVGVASDPLVPLLGVGLVVPAALVVAAAMGRALGWGAARRLPAAVLRTE